MLELTGRGGPPGVRTLAELAGAGQNYAARLTVALGTDREQWQSADELAQLSGIAPVIERSGMSCRVRWR